MRVRIFELRLLAAVLTGLWTIAAAIVLLGYRPGGPIDGVVGLASLLPIAVSLLGLLWPPAARGDRAFAAVAWLGLGAVLLLIPSILGVMAQLLARGAQTLLPSWEAVYPWVLALLATSLFGGLGVARRVLGSTAMRRRRLELGLLIAIVATSLSGSLFAAAAIGNDLALRDRPAISSRFGPTTGAPEPPPCTAQLGVGPAAVLVLTLRGEVDGRATGTIEIRGVRSGVDVSWVAEVGTEVVSGQFALIRIEGTTWTRMPRGPWRIADVAAAQPSGNGETAPFPPATRPALDREVLVTALSPAYRSAAEDRGLEFIEGARSRHCRVALDGRTFEAAFPAVGWLATYEDLHRWRGALDYWIFLDGQIGQVAAVVNGEAQSLGRAGLQANIYATLTATDRERPVTIEAPRT
jgi:hypothetical protein